MCVRVIAPTEDTCSRDIVGKEITKPVNSILGGPSLLPMAVEAMDSDDTAG